MTDQKNTGLTALAIALGSAFVLSSAHAATNEGGVGASSQAPAASTNDGDKVVVLSTALETLKQAPGVSIITAEDIKKRPPVNDLSDIIRRMPGVNLTGNSASGQRGNNRQIDIRGMGPENTLILIDGEPVSSRNSVRYGWRGERDTRGDTNWVPPEQVERIEVLRGPAAARYGSGAMGGVVNIITKPPTDTYQGSFSVYTNLPESSDEGATKRADFSLSGPLAEHLTFRLYGSINKTEADHPNINDGVSDSDPAGNEGVRNKDINALVAWAMTEAQTLELSAGYSRQGNIYTGDTQNSMGTDTTSALADDGAETNRMYRQDFRITHKGQWNDWDTRVSAQYENTRNVRLEEGLAGRYEGAIGGGGDELNFSESELDSYRLSAEADYYAHTALDQVITIGAEWNRDTLDDPASMAQTSNDPIPGYSNSARGDTSAEQAGVYIEDNIEPWKGTVITPGLRVDHHSTFGTEWSPSLNLSQALSEHLTLKAGVARAFKAPNLYQSNGDYLLVTRGNGCPLGVDGPCSLLGNEDLDAETSINKELGLQYRNDQWVAGLTYFRNDYKNKIVSGTDVLGRTAVDDRAILRWENANNAVIQGVEGTLQIPLTESLLWVNNLTWMLENENRDTGNPLSVIPEYTLNSSLDWTVNERIDTQLYLTWYGKQEAPSNATIALQERTGINDDSRSPYSIVSWNAGYRFTPNLRGGIGVRNLFDKRLYREGNSSGAGAATYNEAGRSFYTTLTASF
ncbi:FepA family TonB-dependent siderophore receptor [Larsenimonas suaedae]|uniref:FepA family TonB-dependent siderophore receptor n=1 Tax=Larsenimonas suaedae TaxID=1851019 RepID=A0ABU1GSH6_9GAMM|nr:FepA family TonB-dependent siderophore receptor [Larsenimonas suaedae]MCM2972225.1 FepA family TonB-dependent siderophore receptor [Larsenimonas suaedae]MDR5894979.1 FepA family TonB-dependent siderophore receptor [Larsenimonas suaedae]